MCNGKGWDVAFWPDDEITVQQHFCRIEGDCRSVDKTLEEAADEVASEYKRIYDYYMKEAGADSYTDAKAAYAWVQYEAWKNRTHRSYFYYKNPVDNTEEYDTV